VLVVAAVVYYPALYCNALSFDDSQYLLTNALVKNPGWNSAARFLTEVFKPSTVEGYYQPLTMISLMLDYAAGGRPGNLFLFHLTSLVLHLANAALVFCIVRALFKNILCAGVLSLAFAIHPMTVETITWVGERKTVLASVFGFASVWLYIRGARSSRGMLWRRLSVVSYFLALLAKPTMLLLPVILLFLDFRESGILTKKNIAGMIPYCIIMLLFSVITVISQAADASVIVPGSDAPSRVILTVCHNTTFYLRKIFWPVHLSSHYPFPRPFDFSNPLAAYWIGGTVVCIAAVAVSLRYTRALLDGAAMFFITLLPALGIIGFSTAIASNKYVYFPAIGLIIAAAHLGTIDMKRIARRTGTRIPLVVATAIFLPVFVCEALLTRKNISLWRDSATLTRYMAQYSPQSAIMQHSYGVLLRLEGKTGEAIERLRAAIALDPLFPYPYNDLGLISLAQNRMSEAESLFTQGISAYSEYAEGYNSRGIARRRQGKLDAAVADYRKALELKPRFLDARYNLALALQEKGDTSGALDSYLRIVNEAPWEVDAFNNAGVLFFSRKDYPMASRCFRRILRSRPYDAGILSNMGMVCSRTGKSSQAIDYFKRALSVDSSFWGARVNLARELVAAKEFDEACAVLQRIPEDDSLHGDAQILLSEAGCLPRNGQSGPGNGTDDTN
jgi:tetratricopeptide (TPR) repeat protein